jgi:hypothetical protein
MPAAAFADKFRNADDPGVEVRPSTIGRVRAQGESCMRPWHASDLVISSRPLFSAVHIRATRCKDLRNVIRSSPREI